MNICVWANRGPSIAHRYQHDDEGETILLIMVVMMITYVYVSTRQDNNKCPTTSGEMRSSCFFVFFVFSALMPAADIPRISIQTAQDWNLVKANVAQAMKKAVDDTQTDAKSKEALLAHLLDVRPTLPRCLPTSARLTDNYPHSGINVYLQWPPRI